MQFNPKVKISKCFVSYLKLVAVNCNLINKTNSWPFTDILRQRTRDVEVKKYCVSLLEKLGSFRYTRETLDALDKEARNEVMELGPNPIMDNLLDELLSWKTTAD